MSLTRQQKRQIERKARKHIAAIDRDLVQRIRAEKRGLLHSEATNWYIRRIDPTVPYFDPHQRGLIV